MCRHKVEQSEPECATLCRHMSNRFSKNGYRNHLLSMYTVRKASSTWRSERNRHL